MTTAFVVSYLTVLLMGALVGWFARGIYNRVFNNRRDY